MRLLFALGVEKLDDEVVEVLGHYGELEQKEKLRLVTLDLWSSRGSSSLF